MKQPLSLYQSFLQRWEGGCGSTLCEGARKLVFARGQVPCDILFIGEGPGETENVLGKAFAGPAGKLLDHVISRAVPGKWVEQNPLRDKQKTKPSRRFVPDFRVGMTNLVCCIPREEGGGKAVEPDHEDILACQGRLGEFVELAGPKLLVAVGSLARDYLDPQYKDGLKLKRRIPHITIKHPAAILRASVVHKGMMVQEATIVLRQAVVETFR